MATYNAVIKKRTGNQWDSILPITIAENVLVNENSSVDNYINWINPDSYLGNDKEKLQKAVDDAFLTRKGVVLTREYNITGQGFISMDKSNAYTENFMLCITGLGGGIIKNDSGFVFSSTIIDPTVGGEILQGAIRINNIKFISVEGSGAIIFDASRLMRIFLLNNEILYFDYIIKGVEYYLQTFYMQFNNVVGGYGTLIDLVSGYDINISDNTIEHPKNFFIQHSLPANGGDINPGGRGINTLRIVNNLIEGVTEATIKVGWISVGVISGNYMEMNGSYIDIGDKIGYGLSIQNNFFHDYNASKVAIMWSTIKVYDGYINTYFSQGNMVRGGMMLHGFKSIPEKEINIVSIGDTAVGASTEIYNSIAKNSNAFHVYGNYSEVISYGAPSGNQVNRLERDYLTKIMTVYNATLGNNETKKINIDLSEANLLNTWDNVSISAVPVGVDIGAVSILNYQILSTGISIILENKLIDTSFDVNVHVNVIKIK